MTMKTYKILFLLLAFSIAGCFTDTSVDPLPELQSNSRSFIQFEDISDLLNKDAEVVVKVNGETGGIVEYNIKIANINVNGKLTIPENSFSGTMNISTLFSNRNTTQAFGPSPFNFNNTLLLTLEYSGLNLRKVNPGEIDFYYIDNDGLFHQAEYSSITIDPENGVLKVVDARINHFSRWGWAK
jgi:hypothetical protein